MKAIPIIVLILSAVFFQTAMAQVDVDDRADWKDRVYLGGGGGFNAGTTNGIKYWTISVSPVVGYMVTSNFSVGTGVSYQRTAYSDFNFNYTQYGIMPFARYNFDQLFLTAEYNYINLPSVAYQGSNYSTGDRFFKSRMLFGAGYSQPLGGRGRINVAALYDVLYRRPSVFLSPWVFRVFFTL